MPILNTNIVLNMDPKIYRLRGHAGQQALLGLMLPTVIYKIDIEIENIDENGQADSIKVYVFSLNDQDAGLPLITANI